MDVLDVIEKLDQLNLDELEQIIKAAAFELYCRDHPKFIARDFLRSPLGNAISLEFYRGKLTEATVMRWYHLRWEQK